MQQPRQLATWNSDRDLWETDQLSIFEPLVAYSETLPRSGMTRDGRLYEHLTLAHPTIGPASSSSPHLPTPTSSDGDKARNNPAQARRKSPPLSAISAHFPRDGRDDVLVLPTPMAQHSGNTPENHLRKKPGCKVVTDLVILVENGLLETGGKMLPTPRASDPANSSSHSSPGFRPQLGEVARTLAVVLPTSKARDGKSNDGEAERRRKSPAMSAVSHYFPTPAASDATGGGADPTSREGHSSQIIDAVLDADLWGKYGPAIRRWEQVLGRPAPPPTEPNANGRPRLNAAFVEWMMGLPEGHITGQLGIGREGIKKRLPRTAVLKAIGNGVCPQQALAALAILDPRQAA